MVFNEKSPLIQLGYAPVDEDHAVFVALLQQMGDADNVAFATLFPRLMAHTEQHFERENALMAQSGFPALAEHRGEHARVLGELHHFGRRVEKGLTAFGRSFIRDRLAPWFGLHITTMDAALIAHLKTSANGAAVLAEQAISENCARG